MIPKDIPHAYGQILKISHAIPNLNGTENIQSQHIAEAIQYSSLDRQLWVWPPAP